MIRRACIVTAVSRIPKDGAQTPESLELRGVTLKPSTVNNGVEPTKSFAPRASARPWPRSQTAPASPAFLAGETPSKPCPSELPRGLLEAFQ